MSLLLMIAGIVSFSQEKDSVVADSSYVDESETREADSAKENRYNYYYKTENWGEDTFHLRQVPDSIIKRLQLQDDFWYANKEFEKKKETDRKFQNGFWSWLSRQQWYTAVAWTIIIGGFTAVLIWFLATSHVGIFRRKQKPIAEAEAGEMTENIFAINYPKEIETAIQSRNYRLAVRLLFLQLLTTMSERNVIQYQQGRTNFDYLAQLNKSGYYKDFFRLTRNYEYAWYGEFDMNPDIFTAIKNDFETFEKRLTKS